MRAILISISLCVFGLPGCTSESSVPCTTDQDCDSGLVCRDGVCRQSGTEEPDAGTDAGGDPDGDPGSDPGSDPGGDPGADPGADQGSDPGSDPGSNWLIQPGVGIGSIRVSTSQTQFTTLSEVRTLLGEDGVPIDHVFYTMEFLGGSLLVGGIETNGNQTFDGADHIVSVTACMGLAARTAEGLAPGSTFAEVRQVPMYANPDWYGEAPAVGDYLGGMMEEHFGLGVFFGYDASDRVAIITVTRSYPQPPDAVIDPEEATLKFGATTISCGDGMDSGSLREVHRTVLGEEDWSYSFEVEVGMDTIDMYVDSYRILGVEFVGGDDSVFIYEIDKLVAIVLYPLFYGRTAAPHHNALGSTKAEWEAEIGANSEIVTDAQYGVTFHVYTLASSDHLFAISYTNDGASPGDKAVFIVINYREAG